MTEYKRDRRIPQSYSLPTSLHERIREIGRERDTSASAELERYVLMGMEAERKEPPQAKAV